MSNFYLSENTISQVHTILTNSIYEYDNELFTLFILKHAGLSQHEYIDLSKDSTKRSLLEATKKLAALFISDNVLKEKKNFINPLSMSSFSWSKKNPTESIQIWSTSRLSNNITGGGRQWKSIITNDPENANLIKLKHNYLDYFKGMDNKIALSAIAVWCEKFSEFSRETPLSNIINNFINYFKITEDEKILIFSTSSRFKLEYSKIIIQPSFIRGLIGSNQQDKEWVKDFYEIDLKEKNLPYTVQRFESENSTQNNSNLDLDFCEKLVNKAQQVIFMGPPGTSKSFLAKKLSDRFDRVKRLQFHPQYSYQDFIGGKILENGTLKDKKGELIIFVEEAMKYENKDKSFLLIIEEINRANVSQVFGEMIQLLDRNENLNIVFDGNNINYYLPSNLKIIGTMNTTDRTVGRIDYAIKRRFYQIYCKVDESILIDKTSIEDNSFSIADFLIKINQKLLSTLNNKEMVIGHAIFLKDYVYLENVDKYIWPVEDFSYLFNYVVLPLIEDYCNGNYDLITSVVGEKLASQLRGDMFKQAVEEYLN